MIFWLGLTNTDPLTTNLIDQDSQSKTDWPKLRLNEWTNNWLVKRIETNHLTELNRSFANQDESTETDWLTATDWPVDLPLDKLRPPHWPRLTDQNLPILITNRQTDWSVGWPLLANWQNLTDHLRPGDHDSLNKTETDCIKYGWQIDQLCDQIYQPPDQHRISTDKPLTGQHWPTDQQTNCKPDWICGQIIQKALLTNLPVTRLNNQLRPTD